MTELRVGIRGADDRQSVTIEIGAVEAPSSPVALDLEQLTKLINVLGRARSRMVEETPKQPLQGRKVETVIDPPWYIKVSDDDNSLLAFDHTFYGPVAFVIPKQSVARIVETLKTHLAGPICQQGKLN